MTRASAWNSSAAAASSRAGLPCRVTMHTSSPVRSHTSSSSASSQRWVSCQSRAGAMTWPVSGSQNSAGLVMYATSRVRPSRRAMPAA